RDKLVTGVQTCALPISTIGDRDHWVPWSRTSRKVLMVKLKRTGSLSTSLPDRTAITKELLNPEPPHDQRSSGNPLESMRGRLQRSEERRVGKEVRCRWM